MSSPLSTLWSRVMMMLARGIVTAINDTEAMQTVSMSILKDERKTEIERFQQYGLTSNPPVGLEGLVAFIGGNRSHGIVLAVGDRKFRLQGLQAGEIALYDDQGQKVYLTRDGILIETDKAITHRAPTITLDGDVHITGVTTTDKDISVTGTMSATVDIQFAGKSGLHHKHVDGGGIGLSGEVA